MNEYIKVIMFLKIYFTARKYSWQLLHFKMSETEKSIKLDACDHSNLSMKKIDNTALCFNLGMMHTEVTGSSH